MLKEKKNMERFKIKYLTMLLFSASFFGQQKAIIPKKGIVVFKCTEEIYDMKLYQNSKKEFFKSLMQSAGKTVKKEREEMGIQTDSILLNSTIEALSNIDEMSSKNGINYFIEYSDSLVTKKEIRDGIDQFSVSINYNSRKFINDYTERVYNFSEIKILDFKENKNETKNINGYNCYKVKYSFLETEINDEDLNMFMSNFPTKREMWVTDKIISKFHPIINENEILNKYYPLEIIEFSEMMKGVKTFYKIQELNIE